MKNIFIKILKTLALVAVFTLVLSGGLNLYANDGTDINPQVLDGLSQTAPQSESELQQDTGIGTMPVNPNPNPGNGVGNVPANPNPNLNAGGNNGGGLQDLNDAIGIFSAKCIFPYKEGEQGMGGAETECKAEDSVIGILIQYLQNIIPYIAILVMVWAGFLYYGSATSGNTKQSINAIKGAVGGLVLLLISNIVLGFFTNSTAKKQLGGKEATGLDILFGTATADGNKDGNVISFLTYYILLPALQMMQFVAGAFAVFSLVYAGWLYISSNLNGDTKVLNNAKLALKNAVIGFFVVMLAVSIIAFIQMFANQITPGK